MIEVKKFLKKQFNAEVIENRTKQSEWLSWYRNTNGWRNYKVMLPNKKRTKKEVMRATLNSCKRVCEDWANLLLNEKTDIVVNGQKQEGDKQEKNILNDTLHQVLEQNDFWVFGNKAIEKVFAIGAGAFVLDKLADDKINIEFVDGTRCYVIKCNADDVIDCAFENTIILNGKNHTTLNVHIKNDDNEQYKIYNFLFDEDGNRLSDEQMKELIDVEAETDSSTKTFCFITPQNLACENWDTPFADSIFSKAIDANKMVDLAFDSYCNEFVLGRKRIFISTELVTYERETQNGKPVQTPIFDENEVVFHALPEDDKNGTQIKEVNMELRTEAHQQGIQDALNFFASLCNLGEKYYKYEQGNITTATQVVSENSTLFRNIQKQQIVIERCLKELCFAIFGLLEIDKEQIKEITVQFDDSIIEDKEAERKRDMADVTAGIMSKAEYRAKWYGETVEKAQQQIDLIEGREIENELKRQSGQGLLI